MAATDIPVIDISSLCNDTRARLVHAIHEWGFTFIQGDNTGFTAHAIGHIFELSKVFFQSPVEEKERCTITANNRGWSSMQLERLDPNTHKGDLKEVFNFGEFVDGKAQQPMPHALVDYQKDFDDFAAQCRTLCMQLLRLFALGLKIDPAEGGRDWFVERHDKTKGLSGSILRLLRYPMLEDCPVNTDAATDVRAGAHSDYGSITLLFQRPSQPGLEVLGPNRKWRSVPIWPSGTEQVPFPPILVNVGDLLSYWTNGFLKSTVHRVVFPPDNEKADRYSIAYFFHPSNETRLTAVPSNLIHRANAFSDKKQEEVAGLKVVTAEEHLRRRLAATYGWDHPSEAVD